jgi:hypothetical protein
MAGALGSGLEMNLSSAAEQQDLTCPGASLAHSVALAAHIPAVKAIEANARQYVPAANSGWEKRFPGIFAVRDGMVRTAGMNGPGLGVVPE